MPNKRLQYERCRNYRVPNVRNKMNGFLYKDKLRIISRSKERMWSADASHAALLNIVTTRGCSRESLDDCLEWKLAYECLLSFLFPPKRRSEITAKGKSKWATTSNIIRTVYQERYTQVRPLLWQRSVIWCRLAWMTGVVIGWSCKRYTVLWCAINSVIYFWQIT